MSYSEKYGAGMQITKNWRLNSQRYRLVGVRYVNGEVALDKKYNSNSKNQTEPKPTVLFSK